MKPEHGYRDLSVLTNLLRVLLYVGLACGVAALVSSVIQLWYIEKGASEADGLASDIRQQICGIIQTLIFFLTSIVFSRWIYRANQNVRAMGAQGLKVTPGWAIGWFFIPGFFLWKPYFAMGELWRSSQNPRLWQEIPLPLVLPLWWMLFIGSLILSFSPSGVLWFGQEIDLIRLAAWLTAAADAFSLPMWLVASILVNQIYRAQEHYARTNRQRID